jgi:exopolysaccharide biosynthesis WecB/TagA/CpsF family protein
MTDGPTSRQIGAVKLKAARKREAVADMLSAIEDKSQRTFAFCNMHTFNLARRSPELEKALSEATVFNDGVAIDVASKLLYGKSFPDNLNGTDLVPALLGALDRPTSVFLLGSPPGIAEQAGRKLEERFANVSVVGTQHGFFSPGEGRQIAERIRASDADLVLAGMGNPHQELWAADHGHATGSVVICAGAFLDFASGRVARAPRLVRRIRAEWLFRLLLEPKRLAGRYLRGGFLFLYAIAAEWFAGRTKAPRK